MRNLTRVHCGNALWCSEVGKIALHTESLPAPGPEEVLLATVFSGVSRGTERLVLSGQVPISEYERMRCPYQGGDFPFPVKYGYAVVARILSGPDALIGRHVFALHPHQSHCVLPRSAVTVLPPSLPPRRAVLTANMETALNIVWDTRAQPGDRALVVGCGVVGLLVARLLARMPGVGVTAVDQDARKAEVAEAMGATFATPEDLRDAAGTPRPFDIAVNASASAAGLQLALDNLGDEGRVVEASWFGDRPATLSLGAAFHARRLSIVSSQVSRLPPDKGPRWTHARRLETVLSLLDDSRLDRLLTTEIAFEDAPAQLPAAILGDGPELAIVLRYPAGDMS